MKRRAHGPALRAALLSSLFLLAAPPWLRAQERPGMAERRQEMMEQHQEMMAQHEQMMARMESLAAAMNESTGEDKVDAMAALLNELVAQHRTMHEHMREAMMQRMMGAGHGERMKGMPPGEETGETGEEPGETGEHEHADDLDG